MATDAVELGAQVRTGLTETPGAAPRLVAAAPERAPGWQGPLDPAEAGRRGRETQAALRASRERALPGDVVRHLRVPVNVAATVRRLASEAQRGSTHASRELRAWMDVLESDIPVSTSELDTRTRQRLLTRLLQELQAEDAGEDAPARPVEAPTTASEGADHPGGRVEGADAL